MNPCPILANHIFLENTIKELSIFHTKEYEFTDDFLYIYNIKKFRRDSYISFSYKVDESFIYLDGKRYKYEISENKVTNFLVKLKLVIYLDNSKLVLIDKKAFRKTMDVVGDTAAIAAATMIGYDILKTTSAQKPGDFDGSYHDDLRSCDSSGMPLERHHMPSGDAWVNSGKLNWGEAPCIEMEKADHIRTASYGNSESAIAYREKQLKLIEAGKYEQALNMDIKDIRKKFGHKYDRAIKKVKKYFYDELIAKGRLI